MTLAFRALEHGDLPRMARWLAEPHVQRWRNESADPDRVCAKYGPRIDGPAATRMFAIVEDDRPIGWIQTYEANGRSLAAFAKAGFERIGTVHVADAPRGPEDRAVLRRRR